MTNPLASACARMASASLGFQHRSRDAYVARESHHAAVRADDLWRASGVEAEHRAKAENSMLRLAAHPGWRSALRVAMESAMRGGWPLLHGHRGTGKTQLFACLCRDWCMRGLGARVVTLTDFCAEYRGTGWGSEASFLRFYSRVPLVCIDAFEAGLPGEQERKALEAVLDKRYARELPVAFATNESQAAFEARLGESSASRFGQKGQSVACNWGSLRG